MNALVVAACLFAAAGGDVADDSHCCTPRGAPLFDGSSGDPKILKATKLTLEDEIKVDLEKVLVVCSATRQIGVAVPIEGAKEAPKEGPSGEPKEGYSLLVIFPESQHAYRFTSPVLTRRPRSVRWSKDDGLFIVTAPEPGFANLQCEHSIYIKIDTEPWKPELVYILPHYFSATGGTSGR